jgi:hypothetical protein
MPRDEIEYYQTRAEAEIALAQQASHSKAVQAHYQLAAAYLDMIHGETPSAGPNFLNM